MDESEFPLWRLSEARMVLEALVEVCAPRHFAVFLTGSLMLDNVGRDLDVLLMPTRRGADTVQLVSELPELMGWSLHSPNERAGALQTLLFTDESGRLIDVTALIARYEPDHDTDTGAGAGSGR